MGKPGLRKAVCFVGIAWAAAVVSPAQTLTTLVNFDGANGAVPQYEPLIQGSDGNLYGTTTLGGANQSGTVFKLTLAGQLTTLYAFCAQPGCTDGELPSGPLVQSGDGNFYGTTSGGGNDYCSGGCGTVFQVTPAGVLTTLHTFEFADGAAPEGGLVLADNGNFYGTTSDGGSYLCANGCGTIFEITPAGKLLTLYGFCSQVNCTDGQLPYGPLIQGSDGYLYGTTFTGGAYGGGTVFRITPAGTFTVLHSFDPANGDGGGPYAGLVQGSDGNFYGTTFDGGSGLGGAIFRITSAGTSTLLYNFGTASGSSDGVLPYAGLVQASDGNLYGGTSAQGPHASGTLFEISLAGALTTVHGFDGQDGAAPSSTLVQASNGGIYGSTTLGGTGSFGTLFELSSPTSAGARFSSSSLCFAPQLVGTASAAQKITLTNNGNLALTITSVTSSGDFAETNTCGASLAAGGSCTISVTFSPQQGGARTGALTVADNTGGSPQIVALNGTGAVGSALARSPTLNVDFNGDGEADLGVWRESALIWYVKLSGGTSSMSEIQGQNGDVPVPADYDGDGKSDFALWQPSNGTWYIIPSSNPNPAPAVAWGLPGDVPVPADYDGDGVSDVAVWRPQTGTWYVLPSDGGASISKQWGAPGDVPVVGDYDGDGKADYAVFRPSNGTWYVILSSTNKTATTVWGTPSDVPVEGDYDGDGKTDYAVWQPSSGTWYAILSSTGKTVSEAWGMLGDIPVAGDYNGDGENDYAVFRPSNGTWYIKYSSGGTETIPWGEVGDTPAAHLPSMYRRDAHIANFDGDRKTDIGIFRPTIGTWWVIESSTGASVAQAWGTIGDIIVPGDYDGDGKTDYAVFRPSTGTWYVILSSIGRTTAEVWGESSDVPVPGDYDGDGKTDYAVFRPSTGTWYVIFSSTGTSSQQQWGTTGDIPVPADYDGDGKTDYAVFRPSTGTWYVILSSTGASTHQQWGESGDIPVPGDYDGDTKADYTVFRPSNGTWYTLQSSSGKTITTPYGENGDIPVAKDYDGDEKTDIAVFRPSNATWYILQSSNGKTISTQWGTSTDVPVNKPTGQ